MPNVHVIVGNGFQPTQSHVQSLSDTGRVNPGDQVRAVPGRPWTSQSEANQFLHAVLQASKRKMSPSTRSKIGFAQLGGKEFGIVTFSS